MTEAPPRRLTIGEVRALKVGTRVSAWFWEAGLFVGVVTGKTRRELFVHFDGALQTLTFLGDGALEVEPRHYLSGRNPDA